MENIVRIFAGATVRKSGGDKHTSAKHYKSKLGFKKGDTHFVEIDENDGNYTLTVESPYEGEVYVTLSPEAMEWLIREYVELSIENSNAHEKLKRFAQTLQAARDKIVSKCL